MAVDKEFKKLSERAAKLMDDILRYEDRVFLKEAKLTIVVDGEEIFEQILRKLIIDKNGEVRI